MREKVNAHKFMQVLGPKMWGHLKEIARKKDISVQELLRSIIVPEWYQNYLWRQRALALPGSSRLEALEASGKLKKRGTYKNSKNAGHLP